MCQWMFNKTYKKKSIIYSNTLNNFFIDIEGLFIGIQIHLDSIITGRFDQHIHNNYVIGNLVNDLNIV